MREMVFFFVLEINTAYFSQLYNYCCRKVYG